MASKKPWSWKTGEYGASVTVRERPKAGGNVHLGAYDPEVGGTRWRSLKFKVRDAEGNLDEDAVQAAKEAASELSTRLLKGAGPEPEPEPEPERTLEELTDLFRAEVVLDMNGKHQHETRRELELFERFFGRDFPLAAFGVREWNAIRRARGNGAIDARGHRVPSDKRRRRGPRTVAKTLKTLRHLFSFATTYRTENRRFFLDADPTRGLPMPSETNPTRPIATEDTYQALLEAAEELRIGHGKKRKRRPPLRELLVLAYETGRRRKALLSLRWSDWIPDAPTRHGALRWRADADKLGRESVTPVTSQVRAVLDGWRQQRPGVGEAWVFPAPESDGPIRGDVAHRWLCKAFDLAEIEKPHGFGFHAFRRMFATKRKHQPAQDVAALGGWKGVETLQAIYQREDMDSMEEALLNPRPLRAVREG